MRLLEEPKSIILNSVPVVDPVLVLGHHLPLYPVHCGADIVEVLDPHHHHDSLLLHLGLRGLLLMGVPLDLDLHFFQLVHQLLHHHTDWHWLHLHDELNLVVLHHVHLAFLLLPLPLCLSQKQLDYIIIYPCLVCPSHVQSPHGPCVHVVVECLHNPLNMQYK